MRPAAPDPARPPRSLLDILLIAAAAVTLVLYVLAARGGAWGDDLVLYADALRGVGLFEPISAHVRPVVRLHFLVAAHTVSPDALRWVSLVLHALAAAAAGWAFAPLYGGRIAARAALLFFALPVASEAVFWPAAAGQLYAVLFVLLGVRAWAAGRAALCGLLLLLAAGSYEVWVVALVLLPLWPARRNRDWMFPAAAVAAQLVLTFGLAGAGATEAYGGLTIGALPVRLGIHAARFFALTLTVPTLLAAAAAVFLVLLGRWRDLRVPVALYFVAALVFAFSSLTAARFHYVPQLAVALLLAVPTATRGLRALVTGVIVAYLVVTGPLALRADARDYAAVAARSGHALRTMRAALAQAGAGSSVVLVNRTTPEALAEVARTLRGRPKVIFVREDAINGAVALEDAATIVLAERGLRAVPLDPCEGTLIEIGAGPPRAHACLRILGKR